MMILTDEGWMERGVMSRTLLKRHGAKMLEHFTNIWNAITHKSFWDCKLKISCVERDSKYFERDLNILISSASVSYFFLLLVSDIAAIFLVLFILAVVKMHKNLNFIPQPANSINTLDSLSLYCKQKRRNVNIYASLMKISLNFLCICCRSVFCQLPLADDCFWQSWFLFQSKLHHLTMQWCETAKIEKVCREFCFLNHLTTNYFLTKK